ncbi:hypothetical protein [uncultured Flavonifractor sp.]|uniref:hypothetical protein n=1 Tax=uncultured Flavonifractor sp. TaxID=1193534 RepID=UPI0025975FCD|nr:hypothetical protein [uncultured Flavonifractor sp.]
MQTNVKLKTLLEGLSGKGIEIRVSSLARYTAENGVLVGISCGRARGRFSLSPKLLGLAPDRWDKECKAFYGEHVSMGRLNMVPKELEDRLNQLDTKARRILQAHTVNGTYMPLAEFEDFKAEFEETREEYFRTIQEVVGQWDKIRDDFIAGVRRTVETRGRRTTLKRDRERMVREIISAIPTAREYEARAKMEVTVRAFPTIGAATAGLEPDIQGLVDKTWRDDVTANIVRSIEMNLGEIFSRACGIAANYGKTGKVETRSLNALARTALRVKKMNVFANPLLEQLAATLSTVTNDDSEKAEFQVEEAIVDAWNYARATGISLDMRVCPFDEKALEDMLTAREKAASVGA